MTDPDRLRGDVDKAQTAFRKALSAWRKAHGKPPGFLLEKPAPPLRKDALTQARVFSDRHDMIATLVAPGGVGAEIGVQHGHFSHFLLETLAPRELHLFDRGDALLRDDVRAHPATRLHLGDSSTQLAKTKDGSFDWIYVDGDHSYAGVMKDARASLRKIRPGGLIFFNDYTIWSPGEVMPYGVVPAVNELVNEGAEMIGIALTQNGYFDVVLRPADHASR